MSIRGQLLSVSNDIIPSLGLTFQNHLNDWLVIEFTEQYPEPNENLIRIETFTPTIEIRGQQFNIWSERFQTLAEENLPRKYSVSLNLAHQFCFNSFCNYFEILALGLFDDEAQRKFDEFLFFFKSST
ncbi:hypothetical protein RCC89_03545 [Cytophagaceae bacterium ABcell3]|nr:hypothetical protein RCC89_03545 [Cytophagaceae bacterium ABcell3]